MVSLKQVVFSGIHYLIHPHKLGTIEATIDPDALLPVTLLTTEEIFGGRLEQILADFNAQDDVYIPEFEFVLIEKVPKNETRPASGFDRSSVSQQVYSMISNPGIANELDELPSGPYILHGPDLFQAWRMYPDEKGLFTTGVFQENVTHPDKHRELPFTIPQGGDVAVGVPSRLYQKKSEKKPLAGLRLGIAEAFDLKGTASATESSPLVKTLIELGAVVVGKTKASGTDDGNLDLKKSRRSEAPYEWLDNSVNEDGTFSQAQEVSLSLSVLGSAIVSS